MNANNTVFFGSENEIQNAHVKMKTFQICTGALAIWQPNSY